ncbi:hypothetical protein FKM82_018227 [Ascaphus truei]
MCTSALLVRDLTMRFHVSLCGRPPEPLYLILGGNLSYCIGCGGGKRRYIRVRLGVVPARSLSADSLAGPYVLLVCPVCGKG